MVYQFTVFGCWQGLGVPCSCSWIQTPVAASAGTRLLECALPPEFDNYGKEQIGPEQALWHGNGSFIFLKNIRNSVLFKYSKGTFSICPGIDLLFYQQLDVHNGIYFIFKKPKSSHWIIHCRPNVHLKDSPTISANLSNYAGLVMYGYFINHNFCQDRSLHDND